MDEVEDLERGVSVLQAEHRRWLVIGVAVFVSVAVFALFVGTVVGDIIAFAVVLSAGWLARTEFQMLTLKRGSSRSPRTTRSQPPPTT